jgi:hypothetical protein
VSDPSDLPPILKVKKDAEREIRYHYRRDERVALKRPSRADRQRGGRFSRLFRGRGKSLLPVLLGVLAIGLAWLLLSRDQSAGHLAGYDVRLRASAYEDALLASVTVSWKPRAGERAAEAADATVRFSTPGAAAGSVTSEPLGGGEAVVRGRLASAGSGQRVVAEVAIGGKTVRLTAAVDKP